MKTKKIESLLQLLITINCGIFEAIAVNLKPKDYSKAKECIKIALEIIDKKQ